MTKSPRRSQRLSRAAGSRAARTRRRRKRSRAELSAMTRTCRSNGCRRVGRPEAEGRAHWRRRGRAFGKGGGGTRRPRAWGGPRTRGGHTGGGAGACVGRETTPRVGRPLFDISAACGARAANRVRVIFAPMPPGEYRAVEKGSLRVISANLTSDQPQSRPRPGVRLCSKRE